MMPLLGNVKNVTRVAGLVVALGVVSVAPAHASVRFFVNVGVPAPVYVPAYAPPPPPPPVYVAPAPAPAYGYVWTPGYYAWGAYGYRWVPGAWARPPFARAVWVGPRWAYGPRGRFIVRGYWRR
jgi:hypothetical protein